MSNLDHLTGRIWILHAYDVGDSISLNTCRRALAASRAQTGPRTRRGPVDFGFDPQPVFWEAEPINLQVLEKKYSAAVRFIIYDFGVVSISMSFEFSGSLEEWRQSADFLIDNLDITAIAGNALQLIVPRIRDAIDSTKISELFENYYIFQSDSPAKNNIRNWIAERRKTIAQILRGESTDLSDNEISESLKHSISYNTDDTVIIDWTAALILDQDYEDTLAVLDFANAELLEMRLLDQKLATAHDAAYQFIRSKKQQMRKLLGTYDKTLGELSELMADTATQFEAANNAIKLTNDQFLARVYRLAAERFHLQLFYAAIKRKLETIWEIHQVFTDQANTRRFVILEWLIIFLITLEFLLPLMGK